MTPNEARKPKNETSVKINLELHRITKRRYPEIQIGDRVKIYKKKGKYEKEHKRLWLDNVFTVGNIRKSLGQTFYDIAGRDKPVLRHELLLVG